MQRIRPPLSHALHGAAATRAMEAALAAQLPPHTLMQRAGLAVAQLARALAPHASQVWVVCGPGNNGGDGLEAAAQLQCDRVNVTVTWFGEETHLPADALCSLHRARGAGVTFAHGPAKPLTKHDLCIDALLGIGLACDADARPPPPAWLSAVRTLRGGPAPLLNVDIPSGLQADTGAWSAGFAPHYPVGAEQHTLALLTLKPGLWTGQGRDAAGTVWLDTLCVGDETSAQAATAQLAGAPPAPLRLHDSHKGSYGDVAVVGGEGLGRRGIAMQGAALLAARAALHGGAGRVLVALLDDSTFPVALAMPELMQRRFDALDWNGLSVVCGCGGGEAIGEILPTVLNKAERLVLDADALNAVAASGELQASLRARAGRGQLTVLTPHPLEAARLLACTAQHVQSDRIEAAQQLAQRFGCISLLKGSGSVVAGGADHLPHINPTGNARLATAGTGDVLAGMVGARLAAGEAPFHAACHAAFQHGDAADHWPPGAALTASGLAKAKNTSQIDL